MTTVKPRTARDRASARGLTSNNVVLREYSAHLRDALYTDGAFHVYAPDVEALEKQLRARHNASPGALTPTGQPRLVPIGSRTTRYPPPAICTYLAERDAVHEKLLELSAPQLPKPHLSHQWEGVDACPRMWVAETPRGRTLFVQNANGLGRSTQIEPRHAWPYTKIRLIDSAERWSALRGDLALTAEGPRHRRHGADGPSSVVDTIGCRNAPEVASHAFVIGSRYNCVGPMRGSSLSEWLNEVFVPTFYSLRTRHEQGFPRESLFFDNDCTRIQDEGDTWPSGVLPALLHGSATEPPRRCARFGEVRVGLPRVTSWYSIDATKEAWQRDGLAMDRPAYARLLAQIKDTVAQHAGRVDAEVAQKAAHNGDRRRNRSSSDQPVVILQSPRGGNASPAQPHLSQQGNSTRRVRPAASPSQGNASRSMRGDGEGSIASGSFERAPTPLHVGCPELAHGPVAAAWPSRKMLFLRRNGRRALVSSSVTAIRQHAASFRLSVHELIRDKSVGALGRGLGDAEIVLFVHGADGANLLLMRPCTVVVQLCPCGYHWSCVHHYYSNMVTMNGGVYLGVDLSEDESLPCDGRGTNGSWACIERDGCAWDSHTPDVPWCFYDEGRNSSRRQIGPSSHTHSFCDYPPAAVGEAECVARDGCVWWEAPPKPARGRRRDTAESSRCIFAGGKTLPRPPPAVTTAAVTTALGDAASSSGQVENIDQNRTAVR